MSTFIWKLQLKFEFLGLYSSPNLQKVSLKVMDNETCDQMFLGGRKTLRLPEGIQNSMLCAAGYLDSSHDTCQVRLYLSWYSKILPNCCCMFSYQFFYNISITCKHFNCHVLTTPSWQHLWTLRCACTVFKNSSFKVSCSPKWGFFRYRIFQSTEQ